MTDPRLQRRHQSCLESLRNQKQNLEQTIARLMALMKMLPEEKARNELLEEISVLDVIAENIVRAVEGMDLVKGRFHSLPAGSD